jgi:membrane protein
MKRRLTVHANRFPNAQSPRQFRWRDWKDIAKRIKNEMSEDQISIVAAGIAFYFFLALFPALLSVVSIYGLLASPTDLEQHLNAIFKILPSEGAKIVQDQLRSITDRPPQTLGWSTGLSILATLWSASKASNALITGFNIAYDEKNRRNFIILNLTALAFTLCAVLFFIATVFCIAVVPVLLNFLDLGRPLEIVIHSLRWALIFTASMTAMALSNRYAPSRESPKWKWVSVGSVVGTILWLAVSVGFSYYVKNFGTYNETYGSIAGVIILMFWLYLTAYVLLLSAEINSEIEHQTRADSTVGTPKPMGQRGAEKADTLPETPSRAS